MHVASPALLEVLSLEKARQEISSKGSFFPAGAQHDLSLLVCNNVLFPCWCVSGSSFPSGALQISYFNFAMASKQNDQGCGIMKLYGFTFIS